MYYFLPRNQWEKNFVTLHISLLHWLQGDISKTTCHECIYCSPGIFFFLLILVVLKQVAFYHFWAYFYWAREGATFTPSTWNRTINNQYCSTMGYFKSSFRFILDIKHKDNEKVSKNDRLEFLFPVRRVLTIRKRSHLILLKLVTPVVKMIHVSCFHLMMSLLWSSFHF